MCIIHINLSKVLLSVWLRSFNSPWLLFTSLDYTWVPLTLWTSFHSCLIYPAMHKCCICLKTILNIAWQIKIYLSLSRPLWFTLYNTKKCNSSATPLIDRNILVVRYTREYCGVLVLVANIIIIVFLLVLSTCIQR